MIRPALSILARNLNRRGASALEFAVVVPVLLFIMVSITDLAIAANRSIRLEAAARAAAQFALTAEWTPAASPPSSIWNSASPTQPVPTSEQTVARQAITWLAGSSTATTEPGVSVSITRSCFCDTNPDNPSNPKVCGTGGDEETCTDGTGRVLPTQRYVDIRVTQTYTPLLLRNLSPAEGRMVIRVR